MAQKQFECTVNWCSNRFDTLKDMQKHKRDDPKHFYCRRCDVDCQDWEALKDHKVMAMAPYIEGKLSHKDVVPRHITCEFCGEDFKSWGGRRRHRAQMHQASQDVECPGCQTKFARASDFIAHLEFGECSSISKNQFVGQIQQKHMMGQIMQNPEGFIEKAQKTRSVPAKGKELGLITDGSETFDREEGGVLLLDRDEVDAQSCNFEALQPEEQDLIDLRPQLHRGHVEAWPRLINTVTLELANSVNNMSISSPSSPSGTNTAARGRDHGIAVDEANFPSLGSSRKSSSTVKSRGKASINEPSTSLTSMTESAGAWSALETSYKLFPGAKSAQTGTDWDLILARREDEAMAANGGTNILDDHFWDPASPDYQAQRFLVPGIGKYCCPFPSCNGVFDVASDIDRHIINDHTRKAYTCTQCHKRFKYATSLVAHAESAGRCRVQETTTFAKLLDEISGGFLRAKAVHSAEIYRPEKSLVKFGEPVNGVMNMKYTAHMPGSP